MLIVHVTCCLTSYFKWNDLSMMLPDRGPGRLANEQVDREDDDHPNQHPQDLGEALSELSNKSAPTRGHCLFEVQDGKSDLTKVEVDISDSCQGNKSKWNRQAKGPKYNCEWRFEFNHGNLLSGFAWVKVFFFFSSIYRIQKNMPPNNRRHTAFLVGYSSYTRQLRFD
jgi:hypothetical protein